MKKERGSRKVKRNFYIYDEYKKSFEFLRESKHYIYIVVLIFFIFAALGFFFDDLIEVFFKGFFGFSLKDRILNYIETLLKTTEGMSQRELINFIFFNNLQSSFFAIVLGIFLGAFPIFSAIINGYLLGFVAIMSVEVEGFLILWRILPHGIFELPAVFISLGLGLRLGTFLFRNEKQSFLRLLLNSFKAFILVVFPLLIIAAVIEGSLISLI